MGRSVPEMIGEFGRNVKALVGKTATARILAGREKITTRNGATECRFRIDLGKGPGRATGSARLKT